mmetsp:Transcript_10715/g.22749  ORF Transcript_10715/g.22749 Transcript_10715/m.22749 type:complete len:153 (-) Transcript_10715:3-461(-)
MIPTFAQTLNLTWLLPLMSTTTQNWNANNIDTGVTPNRMKKILALLMQAHVPTFYHKELHFLGKEHAKHPSLPQDTTHYNLLCGLTYTFNSLASSNEPDIFNINADQKFALNKFIHYTETTWKEHIKWYKCRLDQARHKGRKQHMKKLSWAN